jgi:hypothetical protein
MLKYVNGEIGDRHLHISAHPACKAISTLGNGHKKASQDYARLNVVPEGGFEPPRDCSHCDLNAARLPIPPLRRVN